MCSDIEFTALPVGEGDAFYLQRPDFRVLVDGGKSNIYISDFVSAKTDSLDVVVCTHNDSDHANGILGLLENWEGSIREVWLPGSWTSHLKDLIVAPDSFFKSLVENIKDLKQNFESLDQIYPANDLHSLDDIAEGDLLSLFTELSEIETDSGLPCLDDGRINSCPSLQCISGTRIPRHLERLSLEAIDAAYRIRKIALRAFERGCQIRWFKFGGSPSGGNPGFLEPINSKEIFRILPKRTSTLEYLALSKSNRESLVFYCPESKDFPAVFFSADSDLNFNLPSPSPNRSPIVTSPHHGAESNSMAYEFIGEWLNPNTIPIWVRSDSNNSIRPCNSYKSQIRKACTVCNNGSSKRPVELQVISGNWSMNHGSSGCLCT